MDWVLGIDVGTNSTGIALINTDTKEIKYASANVFPKGVNPKDGVSLNEARQKLRSSRKSNRRFKERREKLENELKIHSMMPDDYNTDKIYKKGYHQTYELFKLRVDSLKKQISLKELGKILLVLNKRRGFKSNRKVDVISTDKNKNDDLGKVQKRIELIKVRMEEYKASTLGEYYFKLLEKNEDINKNHPYMDDVDFIRGDGAYTSRELAKDEFEKIWKKQNEYYPKILTDELKLRIGDGIIFYQRDLRSAKHLKSRCKLEFNYSYEYKLRNEEIENQISKLKYQLRNQDIQVLNDIVKNKLLNYLKSQASLTISVSKLKSIIGISSIEKNVTFWGLPQEKIKVKNYLPCAPKSTFEFQEYRIWEQINKIRYINDGINIPLSLSQKHKLAFQLMTVESMSLTDVKKLVSLPKTTKFNDIGDKIKGNVTVARIIKAIGLTTWELLGKVQKKNFKVFGNYSFGQYQLWQNIYFARDNEWLSGRNEFISNKRKVKSLMFKKNDEIYKNNWQDILLNGYNTDSNINIKFTEEQILNIANTVLESDYCNLSSKAIKKLLPFMQNELDIVSASYKVYGEYSSQISNIDISVENNYGYIPQFKSNSITNPVVRRGIAETIKMVNQLLKDSDVIPDLIRIEMARDLKLDKIRRDKQTELIRKKRKEREFYIEFLKSRGFNFEISDPMLQKFELFLDLFYSKEDLDNIRLTEKEFWDFAKKAPKNINEKYKLWLECNRIDPYEGKVISLNTLFSDDVEIEHIIPYSRCGDNSFANRTLSFKRFNALKGNQTPLEYFANDKEGMHKFKKLIQKFPKGKKSRFLATSDEIERIKTSKLIDTAYIAVKIKEHFERYSNIPVEITNGTITSMLRKELGLDSIIKNKREIPQQYFNYGTVWTVVKDNDKEDIVEIKKFPFIQNIDDINEDLYDDLIKKAKPKIEKGQKLLVGKIEGNFFTPFKSRDDHRHHAIDAIVIALANRNITNKIFSASEGTFVKGNFVKKIKQVIGNRIIFTQEAKNEIKRIIFRELGIILDKNNSYLANHNDNLITKNDFRNVVSLSVSNLLVHHHNLLRKGNAGKYLYTPSGKPLIKKNEKGILIHQRSGGDVARGQLHKATFYGKNQNFEKTFTKLIDLKDFKNDEIKNIVDPVLKEYFKTLRYDEKGKLENFSNIFHPVNKNVLIKKVRVNFVSNHIVSLKTIENNNYYVETKNNYLIALFGDSISDRKKTKRDYYALTFLKKAQIDAENKRRIKENMDTIDYISDFQSNKKLLFTLKENDYVLPFDKHYDEILCFGKLLDNYEVNVNELTIDERQDLFYRLFRIVKFDQNGNIILGRHNAANFNADHETPAKITDLSISSGRVLRPNNNTLNAVKVELNLLGTKIKLLNKHLYKYV